MRFFRPRLWIVFLPIVFGCEEKSPTKTQEPFTPQVKDLVGTYQLMHFKLEYSDLIITEQTPGFSISGTMWISQDSTVRQTITMNEEVENYYDKIVKIHNDSVMTFSGGISQYQVKYHFDRINLTFVFEEYDEEYGPIHLTEEWKRVSVMVRKGQLFESEKPQGLSAKRKLFLGK